MSCAGEHCEPAEKAWASSGGDGFDRQLQASTDGLSYLAHRHALFRRRRDTWRSAPPFRSPACRGGRRREYGPPPSDCGRRRHRRTRPFRDTSRSHGVMRPCLTGSWTCGSRTTDDVDPVRAATAAAASSEAARGTSLEPIGSRPPWRAGRARPWPWRSPRSRPGSAGARESRRRAPRRRGDRPRSSPRIARSRG